MATPPTWVAQTETAWNSATTPKTTAGFNANAGDVLVVLAGSENPNGTFGTPTNSGAALTWTLCQSIDVANYGQAAAWWATVDTNRTGMTVTLTNPASQYWGFAVQQWRGSAGVGNSAKANATGGPSVTINTAYDNSALSYINSDYNTSSGTRTWRQINGLNPTERTYAFYGGYYSAFLSSYSDAGLAGSKTAGLTAPAGQQYSAIVVEVRGQAATTSVSKSVSTTWNVLGASASTVNLFSGTPQLTADPDNPQVCLGTEFEVNQTAWVTQVRYLQPTDGGSEARTAAIYSVTDASSGVKVAGDFTMPTPVNGQWCTYTLPTPLQVTPGTSYRVVIRHPAGRYAATSGYFTTGPGSSTQTLGGFVVLKNTAEASYNQQGSYRYDYGAGMVYPYDTFGGASYYSDVTVTTINPAGGTTPVSKAVSTLWNTQGRIAKAVSTTWNARAIVTDPLAASWHARATITDPLASSWHARATVTDPLGTTWNTRSLVSAARSSLWNVAGSLTSVSRAVSTTWHARSVVAGTRSSTWNALSSVNDALSSTWNTRSLVSAAARSTTWNARAYVSAARSTTWNALVPVAAASLRSTTWHVRSLVTQNRSTLWNISSSLLSVSKAMSTRWNVVGRIASARSTTWNDRAYVTSQRTTSWVDRAWVAASTMATSWQVLVPIQSVRNTSWSVLRSVTGTRSTTWRSRAYVVATGTQIWHVVGSVTDSLSTSWRTLWGLETPVITKPRARISAITSKARVTGIPSNARITASPNKANITN